jgi:TRAP-type mannitol/chloroaromatic compound transport system permease small subunit
MFDFTTFNFSIGLRCQGVLPCVPNSAAPRNSARQMALMLLPLFGFATYDSHRYKHKEGVVKGFLALARLIDGLNERVGRAVGWLVLAAVLISAGNATLRYSLNLSSNAWLEIQWYLFSAVFLLGAGYTLRKNEHVRIDILTSRLSSRGRAWIDIICGLLFLMPMAILNMVLSWPMFMQSFIGLEISGDAGGLLRWPVKLLIPVGFALLVLQGASEIIKRVAYLRGVLLTDPGEKPQGQR